MRVSVNRNTIEGMKVYLIRALCACTVEASLPPLMPEMTKYPVATISICHHQGATYRTCQHLNAEHSKSLFYSSLFTQCIAMSQHLREVVTIEVLSAIVSICRIPPFPNTVERPLACIVCFPFCLLCGMNLIRFEI